MPSFFRYFSKIIFSLCIIKTFCFKNKQIFLYNTFLKIFFIIHNILFILKYKIIYIFKLNNSIFLS